MSYKCFILFFLIIIVNGTVMANASCDLIISYLKTYNIKLCHIYTCWEKNANLILGKRLNDMNVRYSFVKNEKNFNLSLLEKPVTYYGFILDLSCSNFIANLKNHINEFSLRLCHPLLLIARQSNQDQNWENIFESLYLRMDSNVKLAVPHQELSSFYKIFDVYNPAFHIGEKPKIIKIGGFNGTHFDLNRNSNFHLQRRNMSGIVLRVGSVVLVPNHSGTFEEYMLDSRYKHLDTMSKFHYPMFLLLENYHRFKHTLKIDNKWFGNYQNGTDDGTGKLLYDNIIDITCTGASQRPPRIDTYDYLMPSYHFRPCYIFRNPGTYNPLSNQFLTPFSNNVWYLTLTSLLFICVLIKVFDKVEGTFFGTPRNYSWATAIVITVCPLVQQGAWTYPSGHSGRFLYVIHLMLSILLYNYYTSSILSSLLSKPPQAFRTLDELGHSKLDIGIENLPYTITWFEIMNDSDVQYIYKHKVYPPGAKNLNIYEAEEGIAKVRKGGFAYHTQLDTGYPIIARTFNQDAICDITAIPMIPQVSAGIMVRKQSQYKELFHITLRLMKQAGLVHRISKIWESEKPLCLSSTRIIAVGADQMFMAFLSLFVGMAFSVLFLVMEIFWFKFDLDSKNWFFEIK